MGIKPRGDDNKATLEEFKKWLKKYDTNNDGKISREELRAAIRDNGGLWEWLWSNSNAKYGVTMADKNNNGVIDDDEIVHLVKFADEHLGYKIVPTGQ